MYIGRGKQLNDFLAKFDVRSIVEEQDTVVVEADSSFVEALRCLTTHSLSSAPVYDKSSDTFVGLIDILDVVSFFCRFVRELGRTEEETSLDWKQLEQLVKGLPPNKKTQLEETKVVDLVGLSGRNGWKPVSVETEPSIVFRLLADPHTHRIPVTDEQGRKFLGVLTQTDAFRWLWMNINGLPADLRTLKVSNFAGKVSKEIVTVPYESTMLEAFMLMHDHHVSGLPAVDSQGKIRATVSASDCQRLLSPTERQTLWDILAKLFYSIRDVVTQSEQTTCQESSTLEEIIQIVATHRVHRVWVVDNLGRPVGVVSLSDVLRQLELPREDYCV